MAIWLQDISLKSPFRSAFDPPSLTLQRSIEDGVRAFLRGHVSGLRDYALAIDGARIVPRLTTGEATKPRNGHFNRPDVVLRDNLSGGRCWTIPESRGQVGISVSRLIFPSHITVDHVPPEAAEDIQQAPRHMRFWGSVDGSQNSDRYKEYFARYSNSIPTPSRAPNITNGYNFVHLGDFEYDVNATWHIQTFPVHDHILPLQMDFGVFVIEILDNWGSPTTCLYRFRIHGRASFKDEL